MSNRLCLRDCRLLLCAAVPAAHAGVSVAAGKYSLLLSHPAQRLVGVRLVELFCQQHIEGLCSYPHSVCFTAASLDDMVLPAGSLEDPLRIRLPKSGILKMCGAVLLGCWVISSVMTSCWSVCQPAVPA